MIRLLLLRISTRLGLLVASSQQVILVNIRE
jgi:hypothetical protein